MHFVADLRQRFTPPAPKVHAPRDCVTAKAERRAAPPAPHNRDATTRKFFRFELFTFFTSFIHSQTISTEGSKSRLSAGEWRPRQDKRTASYLASEHAYSLCKKLRMACHHKLSDSVEIDRSHPNWIFLPIYCHTMSYCTTVHLHNVLEYLAHYFLTLLSHDQTFLL